MITPRTTRLLRAPDLHAFRDVLVHLACAGPPLDARDRLVVVPTRAAASQLIRSTEHRLSARTPAAILPDIITRDELTGHLARRLPERVTLLTEAEREVLLGVASRAAAASGDDPPFRLRPALVAEMLRFYDALRRHQRDVDAFERLALGALEPGAAVFDRGAERLVRQTRFLASAFRRFERLCAESGSTDEHGLRAMLLTSSGARPWREVVLATGDRAFDPYGLWAADWDLLARLPGLERLDVVVTDRMLAGAFHERIHQVLPGIEEVQAAGESPRGSPALVVPTGGGPHRLRDREEEVAWFARWIRAGVRAGTLAHLDRAALVVRQPLPYVYLARDVFRSASIPCQMFDALPLAAEPFAAALDLVFAFVSTNFSRVAVLALLRSPHVRVGGVSPQAVAALDRSLSERGYLGDLDALRRLVDEWETRVDRRDTTARAAARAGRLACDWAAELQPMRVEAPAAEHLARVTDFLESHGYIPGPDDPMQARQLRARGAVLATLGWLRDSHARWDQEPVSIDAVAAMARRWIEGQTFAPRTGDAGVHLVDAASARFGDFTHVQLAGLVDGEWPAPPRRNIFYSPSILRDLGWPSESDRLDGERAAFTDLLHLASAEAAVSAFTLEDDAVVTPSALFDEVDAAGLARLASAVDATRVFDVEALCHEPLALSAVAPPVQAAATRRLRAPARTDRRFRGSTTAQAPAACSVSALERFQDCPFKYFAANVLGIEEPPEDDPALSPKRRGRFIHEVFQRFFDAWDRRSGGTIAPSNLDEARAVFEEVAAPMLATLPEADASLERARLFGSAIMVGMVDQVLALEAARPAAIVERWLERRFDGAFTLGDASGRHVVLKGVADRVDLLEGRRLRVIDYKSGAAPDVKRALQVPVYGLCAVETLSARDGTSWTVDEAAYVAFSGRRTLVPVVRAGTPGAEVLAGARARLFGAVDGIASGAFPPRPYDPVICGYCAYPSVCRKDYVGDE